MVLLTLYKRTDKTKLQLSKVLESVDVAYEVTMLSVLLCAVQSHSCELADQQTDSNEIYTTVMPVEAIQHFTYIY